jgi:hypothetical protein
LAADHASRGDEQLLDADPHWLLILKPLSMRMIVLEKLLQRALGVLLSTDATYQGQFRRAADLERPKPRGFGTSNAEPILTRLVIWQ